MAKAYNYGIITMQQLSESSHALELINNGFLKYAHNLRIQELEAELKKSFDLYDADISRIVHVDAEELAEFSFDFFLPGINEILAKRGFKLLASKLNADDNSFDVLLNGNVITLYGKEDLRSWNFWDVASRNFFKELNKQLVAKGVDEQFCLFYGGNDLHAMLLTDKQYSLIADYYKNLPKEAPYKP